LRSERDTGLVRAVGTGALAAGILNTVVGAGIFAVPGALAASIGSYAPLAFVVCAIAVGSVAICFAEGGSRVATSGGAYGYIEAAFGPLVGYVAGILLLSSDVLACSGIAAALADVMTTLASPNAKAAVHAAVIVGVVGGIALVNVSGVGHGAKLVYGATVLKLIPLVVFVLVGASAVHAASFAVTTEPSTQGLGRALILALFAFSGMEAPLSASGEVSEPARTIPRALAISMISVTVLYILVQVVAQGILGPSLGHSTVPLADAMARVSPALRLLMLGGAALSMFGWIGSDILGTPRVLFAFARDGMLPRVLGRVHPRTHAPHVAIVSYAALAIALALTGTFAELAVLSTLAVAPLYIAGCGAAFWLARRGVAEAGAPLGFRWLRAAMITGTLSMLAVVTLASRAEILGLASVLAVSTAVYTVQSRVRRAS
jgi:APA family basic amino acid/polyamine antiporter